MIMASPFRTGNPSVTSSAHGHVGRSAVGVAMAALFLTPTLAVGGGVDLAQSLPLPGVVADYELETLEGETLNLGDLRGEVVVVNFWASWCAPCRKELPWLATLHQQIADRGGRVVAVAVDDEGSKVRKFAERYDLDLPICHDGPSGLANVIDLPSLPFTLVLDRSGQVALLSTDSTRKHFESLRSRVEALVAEAPPASASLDRTAERAADEGGTP